MSWVLCNKCKHIVNKPPCENYDNDLSEQIDMSKNTRDDYKKVLDEIDKEIRK